MLDYGKKIADEQYKSAVLFGISSWILLLSLVYVRNGQTYLGVNFTEILVSVLLGILHTIIDDQYYGQIMDFYNWESEFSLKLQKFIRFLVMAFANIGIWQCVLLPMSGLGLVEFFFVLILLILMISNNRSAHKKGSFIFSINSPMYIVIFQITLFFLKIASWIMPENVYKTSIEGNFTIRIIIAVIVLMFIISGILSLKRKILPSTENSKKVAAKSIKAGGNFLKKIGLFVFTVLMSFTYGPIIFSVIIGVGGLAIVALLWTIPKDTLKFVEPMLKGLLSSGKYQFQQTSLYIFSQIILAFLYIFYRILISPSKISDEDLEICLEYVKKDLIFSDSDEKNMFDKEFRQSFCENRTDVFYNPKAYANYILDKIRNQISYNQ